MRVGEYFQMNSEVARAEGVDGVVSVFADRIRIKRKGQGTFFTHGLQGDKDVQLSSISSVQFKKAGRLTSGYIQFAFLGGNESKGGLLAAARDENSVLFRRSQQPNFEAVRDAIQARLSEEGHERSSAADEIEKLATLKDRGVITEQEFEAKKRQLLGL